MGTAAPVTEDEYSGKIKSNTTKTFSIVFNANYHLGPFSSEFQMFLKDTKKQKNVKDVKEPFDSSTNSAQQKQSKEQSQQSLPGGPFTAAAKPRECIHKIRIFAESKRSRFSISPPKFFPAQALLTNHPQRFVFEYVNESDCVDILNVR